MTETITWMQFQGPNFTLRVPSRWFVLAAPNIQAMFAEPGQHQALRANLVVTLRTVEPTVTALAVGETSRESQERDYPDYQIETEGPVALDNTTGYYRAYQWYNQENNVHVVQSQSIFIKDQNMFTLTTSCSDTAREVAMPLLNEMLRSFQFTG